MNLQTSDAPSALVVDDNFSIRTQAIRILNKAGFQVLDAENADAALDLLEIRYSDVVLLFTDVQMPGQLDGFALARKVAESWPHISIIVASGIDTPGPGSMPDKARFINKPFSAELVRAHLQELLPDGQKPEPLKRGKPAANAD
jgi:CheY-like chemotaxis protein